MHLLAYAITANGVCLHLLVPPFAQCCFFSASCHNHIYCGINGWVYFQEKSTLCNNFIQKRGLVYFQGWACFQEILVNLLKLSEVELFITAFLVFVINSTHCCECQQGLNAVRVYKKLHLLGLALVNCNAHTCVHTQTNYLLEI